MSRQGPSVKKQSIEVVDARAFHIAQLNDGVRSTEPPDSVDPRMPWVEFTSPLHPPEYYCFGNRESAQRFVDFVVNSGHDSLKARFL